MFHDFDTNVLKFLNWFFKLVKNFLAIVLVAIIYQLGSESQNPWFQISKTT